MSQELQKYFHLKEAADVLVKESEDFAGMADDILVGVVIETIQKYQQKINVGIQDSVTDLLDNFKINVAKSIFEASTQWRVANRDSVLFPRGCRFAYTKGRHLLFVVEQEPQVRSLLFSKSIIEETQLFDVQGDERLAIALPYVIFLIHIYDDKFSGLYCGWKNSPLQSIDDGLSNPILPNIHETMAVCTGPVNQRLNSLEPNQICKEILSDFWNTKFNGDLSSYWFSKGDIDKRIRSAISWAEHSKEDSSFILQIPQKQDRTLNYLINLLTRHEFDLNELDLRDKLSDSIDKCVEKLFFKILRFFKNNKFEKYHPKDIKDTVRKVILKSNAEFTDMVFAIVKEFDKIKNNMQEKNTPKTISMSKFWNEFSS